MNKAETTGCTTTACRRYARRGTCVTHWLPKWDNRLQGGAYFNLGDGNSNPVSSTRRSRIATNPVFANCITTLGSFTRNDQTQLAADINLAVNFAITDSNPNRALGETPILTADIFALPWLRGYGTVKSLNVAYQESETLKQAATDLVAQGGKGARRNWALFKQGYCRTNQSGVRCGT